VRIPTPWPLPDRPTSFTGLLAGGVTRGMLVTQLRNGALVRVRHGVYLAASAWPDDPAAQHLVRAHAELVANPGAVLSHQSAGVAWRLPSPGRDWASGPVAVTLPGAGNSVAHTQAVHHVAALPESQVEHDDDGYAVTSLARTAVDLAEGLDLPAALVVLDAAARGLCTRFVASPRRSDYTNPRLVEAARRRLEDVALTRRGRAVLEPISLAEPCRESPAESLSAGHFQLAGLPVAEFQAPVHTAAGTFFPDFLWRERRLIGECDGAVKYSDSRAWVAEKQREQLLRDLGYDVVRWLGFEIMRSPAAVVDRVARALGM
jgi:hypothetical protein